MRIISNFHDYYDGLQDGSDKERTWIRKQKVVRDEEYPLYRGDYTFCKIEYYFITVGFCGKLYPCIKQVDREQLTGYGTYETNYWYSWADFRENFPEELLKRKHARYYHDRPELKIKRMEKSFVRHAENSVGLKGLFDTHKVPAFLDTRNQTIVNPHLGKLTFYRVFPTAQTFQEIEMFVFGNLGLIEDGHSPKYRGEPMSMEVSDKDMVQAKGFDLKYSFRKPKGKKKRGKNR